MSTLAYLAAVYAGVFVCCCIAAAVRGITVWQYLAHLGSEWMRGWGVWLRVLGIVERPRPRTVHERIAQLERELEIGQR